MGTGRRRRHPNTCQTAFLAFDPCLRKSVLLSLCLYVLELELDQMRLSKRFVAADLVSIVICAIGITAHRSHPMNFTAG